MQAEEAAGEFTLQVMLMFFIFLMMATTIFFVTYIQTSDIKTYVNGQIERNGGLTATAVQNINDYSSKYYDKKFSVTSLSGNDKKPFGSEVNYIVNANVKVVFFDLPDQLISSRGSAVSKVR